MSEVTPKGKLILMRHGQSLWNKNNLFTGWVDVPLSPKGVEEALEAGRQMADIEIDVIFVSSLMRAQLTAMIAMSQHKTDKTPVVFHKGDPKLEKWSEIKSDKTKDHCIPVFSSEKLNERMYGDLQGLNKDETRAKFGKEQVHIWRRSYDVAPPNGESLKMTADRTWPYFQEEIKPFVAEGKTVLVSAHGNSLRAIMMHLDNLSETEVVDLEIPTGVPIFYSFEGGTWNKESIE